MIDVDQELPIRDRLPHPPQTLQSGAIRGHHAVELPPALGFWNSPSGSRKASFRGRDPRSRLHAFPSRPSAPYPVRVATRRNRRPAGRGRHADGTGLAQGLENRGVLSGLRLMLLACLCPVRRESRSTRSPRSIESSMTNLRWGVYRSTTDCPSSSGSRWCSDGAASAPCFRCSVVPTMLTNTLAD
jgi:hypothetical protein